MKLKEYDIVIEPREIIFEHIQSNKVFTKTINIKNVGNKSKRMELFRPGNKVFKLVNFENPELPVPPGMEIAAKISFETANSQDYNDKMMLIIDNNEIEIPIQAFPAKPILKIEEKVDFGTQSASNKTISINFKISNIGALEGEFSFSYQGKYPITFVPAKDTIPPYSDAFIRVDLFTKYATKVEEKAEIILRGSDKPLEFKILANVMEKQLILLDSEKNQPIHRIDFGSCYYGCNLTNLAILYNSSPEKVDYVILLEENGVGAEIGAEFSKSTKVLKATQNDYKESDFCPLSKLITAFPNNGTLEPFEKRPLFFRFNPECIFPKLGFSTTLKPPQRRDYAVFLYLEQVGDHKKSELAITGTALPVMLRVESSKLDFGVCEIGQKKELTTILYNDSELKPIKFKFRKVANYIVNPASGQIMPKQQKEIVISFVPNQIGSFKYDLVCEVIDKLVDKNNPLLILDRGISEISLQLTGNAIELKKIAIPKYSGGTDPLLTNEVGLNVNTTLENLKSFVPKAAVQNGANSNLHKFSNTEKATSATVGKYKVAYPNDRSKSIGPFDKREKYKTIFTGVDRYNYTDPDYAYNDLDQAKFENHKRIYKDYLESLNYIRAEKTRNKEYNQYNDTKNIGLKPAAGLIPQKLSINELHKEASKKPDFAFNESNNDWKLISSDDLTSHQKKLKSLKENPVSVSTISNREKEKLSVQLTPAQIYKVIVSPSVIDFGEVCIKSTSTKSLEILNCLDQPILIELENDCIELRQTNPLSQVIQPQSKGVFSLVFDSEGVQTFQRSISYRINNSYRHHIIVLAEAKLQSLTLSKNHVVLNQLVDVQPEVCYRSNLTVKNPYNTITEFTWMPIYGEQGTAFSIRPATGIIEPFKDIDCEIVWHGSYLAPLTGTFSLLVTGGESNTLTCEAKLGSPQLQFISRRAMFGKIPLNMVSSKTFYITNNGTHNAFFQILDPKPIQGMTITPTFGMAPLNTLTAIKVEINPTEILKFDARIMVQVRGSKTLELRFGGETEEPLIDIDVTNFEFGGIYSGASCSLPFKLINASNVKGKVEFNLKKYSDYSIKYPHPDADFKESANVYELTIQPEKILDLDLVFSPTEVASYEFDLPITINKPAAIHLYSSYDQMTPYSTSEFMASANVKTPATAVPGTRSAHGSRQSSINYATPRRRITAIGLRSALKLTETKIHFKIPIKYYEKLKEGGFYEAKSTVMTNNSNRNLKWCLDMRNSNKITEQGIFKICNGSKVPFVNPSGMSFGPEGEIKPNESFEFQILFSPDQPGTYNCKIPIVVNDNFDQPYYYIEIIGELLTPELIFDPEVLILKPVPLGIENTEKFIIKHSGYENDTKLSLKIADAKTLDGEPIDALSVTFLNGSVIMPKNENNLIELEVKFSSSKPISTSINLLITDDQNREYQYKVIVTADNSLFTCYAFLADHLFDFHIVLEEGHIMKGSRTAVMPSEMSGEPILRPYSANSKYSQTQTGSPSFDAQTSQSVQSRMKDIDADMRGVLDDAATPNLSQGGESRVSTIFTKGQEPLLFPSNETNSGVFTYEILKILQRWFRCNGWPNSLNLVKIPDSFRGCVSRKPFDENQEKVPQQDAVKRENKTIYEMITHLSGRSLPAIPVGPLVPSNLVERTNQFHWQHNVLLKFLEIEGGCISHIKAEHLLDTHEFKTWLEQNEKKKEMEASSGFKDSLKTNFESVDIPIHLFQLVSRKAWLDLLLQLLKVCVINRITPKSLRSREVPYNEKASFPYVKSDPLISNIYSMGERVLLTWLNYLYNNYKDKIWTSNERGTPSTRWIVNFDVDLTDSLTLAAVIGAYCPFIIETHLNRMYIMADTAEKCFHNALILIDSLRELGLDYDINSLDITDPNPIGMILFCAFLYDKLPNYIPSASIEFSSPLHQIVTKKIKISNPNIKNIFYNASIIGPNASNFSLPNGNQIPLNPKASVDLVVNYVGNNLKAASAYLLLNGKKQASLVADTIVFSLNANIDELTPAKTYKLQTALYEPTEVEIEAENPYDQAGEFKITIIESPNKNGVIKNPFSLNTKKSEFIESESDFKLPTLDKANTLSFKQQSKSVENIKNKISNDRLKEFSSKEEREPKPYLSAFNTRIESVYLEPKSKKKVSVTYLPVQLYKHTGIVLFSNDKLGEFLYNLEGTSLMPEKSKIIVDEQSLDTSKIKLIKLNRKDNNVNMFRCFAGDKVEVKFLIPVCNMERESAIMLAAEMRMSELELKRRKLHGALSSKSLLEALEKLTLNKEQIEIFKEKTKTINKKNFQKNNSVSYTVQSKNNAQFHVGNTLKIDQEYLKSDENLVPLSVRFSSDRPGLFSTSIDLFSDPDDIRTIPIEIKVTESNITDASVAYLQFNTNVFESTNQQIPIKNNSDILCHYEVEMKSIQNSITDIFTGAAKFSIRQKENFLYDLKFSPISEEIYQAELIFNNITEGIKIKYHLTGTGERCTPLGEIKFESRVGQMSQHEILIPNRSNKKVCYYISSSSTLINGPDKLMLLPNKKELYKFDILPKQRGEYKGTVTFRPGQWPIKDIDSDGEEIVHAEEEEEKIQNFTLWFTFDLKVNPPEPQSVVDIKSCSLETYSLVVPLYNPFDEVITLNIKINGPYLEGSTLIDIPAKEKFKYTLDFKPIQIGKYKGSLIFMNEKYGEFWYDLKLTCTDPLPIQLEPIKAEVGRFAIETIKLKNPLNENLQFKTFLTPSSYFSLERRQSESISVNANDTADVNIIFIPAAIGFSDHYAKISFFNEKTGKLIFDLSGLGTEPDIQDPINITSELGQSQIVTINFRNSTDSAIYCDISLKDENFEPIIVNSMVNKTPEPNQIFNILLEKLESVHVAPRSILEIPVMFIPNEMKKYNVNLVVQARREAQLSWLEPEPKQGGKIKNLKWIYPIKAFTVINAISKANPFVLECMTRKRLEKRMEVVISDVSSYSSSLDKSAVKLRSITPQGAPLNNKLSNDNLIIIGDINNLANEFMHSIQFNGNIEQCQIAKNSVAMKLIRSQREKTTGLMTLIFDFIFCPSQSFVTEAYLQIETALGGMWRYPIKLIAIEPPSDDIIQIEVTRLNREFLVGFKLDSKLDKSIPFKAEFIGPSEFFTVYPLSGELLPASEDGTLIKVGFTSPSYGKIYATQLIISTPIFQWKYQVKGVTSEYQVPRGLSAIPRIGSNSDPRLKRVGKKKNYVIENTYIIQTAVSSTIKGASLVHMKYCK